MAPFKRVRQPKITTQALLDFDLGESSSDSDFLPDIDNCSDGSKDESDGEGDSSDASSSSDSDSNADSGDDSDDSTLQLRQLLADNNVNQADAGAAIAPAQGEFIIMYIISCVIL